MWSPFCSSTAASPRRAGRSSGLRIRYARYADAASWRSPCRARSFARASGSVRAGAGERTSPSVALFDSNGDGASASTERGRLLARIASPDETSAAVLRGSRRSSAVPALSFGCVISRQSERSLTIDPLEVLAQSGRHRQREQLRHLVRMQFVKRAL